MTTVTSILATSLSRERAHNAVELILLPGRSKPPAGESVAVPSARKSEVVVVVCVRTRTTTIRWPSSWFRRALVKSIERGCAAFSGEKESRENRYFLLGMGSRWLLVDVSRSDKETRWRWRRWVGTRLLAEDAWSRGIYGEDEFKDDVEWEVMMRFL